MTFECEDLERALAVSELMPDAVRHAKTCERCRKELLLWKAISDIAPSLHQEWDSPDLWPKIRSAIADKRLGRKPEILSNRRRLWAMGLAAAAAIVVAAVWLNSASQPNRVSQELLTEQALRDVQAAEAAYIRSIDNLSRAAQPILAKRNSDILAVYREKLMLLDTAIADVQAQAEMNRFNAHLQLQIASLYREKQHTLEEIVNRERQN